MAYEFKPDSYFDDEFISKVDKQIQSEDPNPILSTYRKELFNRQFYIDCHKTWPHTYDFERLKYVTEKIIKKYGSIEQAIAIEEEARNERWKRIFPRGIENVLIPVDELAEREEYSV